jgi:hypothetical protein
MRHIFAKVIVGLALIVPAVGASQDCGNAAAATSSHAQACAANGNRSLAVVNAEPVWRLCAYEDLTKKIVDGKGRVVPASTPIEETHLTLAGSTPDVATRIDHEVTIVKAARRFPDDPDYQWPLDGLRVTLVTFQAGDGNSIEVRYDTREGRGSFWETLRRQRPVSRRAVG